MLVPRRYTLEVIAENGDRFRGFDPYVGSIDERGAVYFQAARRDGGTGIYRSGERGIEAVAESTERLQLEFFSHPDVDGRGTTCFYARRPSGECFAFRHREGRSREISPGAGPLGPTINESGTIAYRAELTPGVQGVYTELDGQVRTIAKTNDRFASFQGLPVVNRLGHVVFRADLKSGGQGIYVAKDDGMEPIVETGAVYSNLSNFPTLDNHGTAAFCATSASGISSVMLAFHGRLTNVIDSRGPFESFRGALIDDGNHVVFYATPRGQGLGIFTGPDPQNDKLLAMGAPLYDSSVTDFALNPVSINSVGQLAIRVSLADKRQLIVRADPN